MQQLDFLKLVPGGNPTILISSPVPAAQRMALAKKLMDPLHLQAEQVGYINLQAGPPRLEMMGGEFCLNATRCLVFEMARQKLFLPLAGTEDLFGLAQCSGAAAPLPVRVKNGKTQIYPKKCASSALSGGLRALVPPAETELARDGSPALTPAPAPQASQTSYAGEISAVSSLECMVSVEVQVNAANMIKVGHGATLVRLPGIAHLLLDENLHPLPQDERSKCGSSEIFSQAVTWLDKLGLKNEPASGIIWYRDIPVPRAFAAESEKIVLFRQITPVVHVAETGSCILESACGSATLALGLLEATRLALPDFADCCPRNNTGSETSLNNAGNVTEAKNTGYFGATTGNGQLFLNVRQPSGQNLRQKVVYSASPASLYGNHSSITVLSDKNIVHKDESAYSTPKAEISGNTQNDTGWSIFCEAEVGGMVRLAAEGVTFV